MATLILQTAGQAVGGALGGPLGAVAGRAIGALAGGYIDQAVFGPPTLTSEGPRLTDLHVMTSSEGAPMPRVWGRARLAGQVIWATNLEEQVSTRTEGGGGKATGGSGGGTRVTEYSYYANFAVGLCEGPLQRITRAWADGKSVDLSQFNWRFYPGSEEQTADSLIVAKEGEANAPAYRGTAYVVFERMPLAGFGNRIPQMSFEVFRPIGDVEDKVRAVNIIPGATEFGYDSDVVKRAVGWGETAAENTHSVSGRANWHQSLDDLQASCSNIESAALVVAWFGDDLRCGHCKVRPGVDAAAKATFPHSWSAGGVDRSGAYVVSHVNGGAAYGGTPTDGSVVRALNDLKRRGLETVFYPFIMMDIAQGNALPNPYTGEIGQPAYPWRGRITCDPAPGASGSTDKTATAATQIDSFFGSAGPEHFSRTNSAVHYSGPDEWSFARMVLHYANLCALAGGVDAFVLCGELIGLTTLRDGTGRFPFVDRMRQLAGDVAAILPAAKLSYAADWSEYFGHQPADGSGDVFFHLDSLWADSNIDFIGIDNYMPVSDWRDGGLHLDALAGYGSIYDQAYLSARLAGGEGYDWYYASSADRELQVRTAITDGAYDKPWVFRYKDLVNWWSHHHFDRPGGIEAETPTPWTPRSKPIWFTEAGCASVDRATNQPNVFIDPKSAESGLPHGSKGIRDDFIQRRYIEVLTDFWQPAAGSNPISPVYNGPMVRHDRIHFWAWDARPFPAFPLREDIWADGGNYQRGHWLNGRMGAAALGPLVAAILTSYGFHDYNTDALQGVVDGFIIENIQSARDVLEPLSNTFAFDAVESGGVLVFRHRDVPSQADLYPHDLVEDDAQHPLFTLTRAQESELPQLLILGFIDPHQDHRRSSAEARRLTGSSRRTNVVNAPVVMARAIAQSRAQIMLQEIWSGRESAVFWLPASLVHLEPGDAVTLHTAGGARVLRIEEITGTNARQVQARLLEASVFEPVATPERHGVIDVPAVYGPPRLAVMELPGASDDSNPFAPWIAAAMEPWPGSVTVLRDAGDEAYTTDRVLTVPAVIGETLEPVTAGPSGRFDFATSFTVYLASGTLQSVSDAAVLNGANRAALGSRDTGWEIFQFANAELVGDGVYRISRLLRGLAGSEPEIQTPAPMGSVFVVLDDAVSQLDAEPDAFGRQLNLRIGPSLLDHGDPAFVDMSMTVAGLALRPRAPVHVRARREDGDIVIAWIRQTRYGGDAWDLAEVPLNEHVEAYDIIILNAGAVVRRARVSSPVYRYDSGEQTADFGDSIPATAVISIAQVSALFGPGSRTEIPLNV